MAEKQKTSVKKTDDGWKKWWQGLKAEYGKIIWTDRQTLITQTIVVVIITVILGAIISILDAGILGILNLLIH